MKFILIAIFSLLLAFKLGAQPIDTDSSYSYRPGDPNGIGKWYMGREIAHVMGYQGISWLERRERENEERTSILLKYMDIHPEDVIADIGAGSGYHVFRIAPLASKGILYGVDIQDEMLEAMQERINKESIKNVKLIKGSFESVNLPVGVLDKVLMVDVYHEFSFPVEMIRSISSALKPEGKIYLIEYRAEDPRVPIKRLHKMTEAQAVKEMSAAGFRLEKNIEGLPWQHCMVFVKN